MSSRARRLHHGLVALAGVVGWLLLAGTLPALEAADPAGGEFYEKKIRPVLAEQCYACHSATAKKPKGGLLLDSRAGLLKGGDSGPGFVPGKPAESLIIRAVRYTDDTLQMPPKQKLPEVVIADLEKWIAMGAPDADGSPLAGPPGVDRNAGRKHWSFQPVGQVVSPTVNDTAWPKSAIDRFILAGLEAKGLHPAPQADRRTLIRRATFDLTGLPPTPAEVEAFVHDESPDAFARVVDRLLASPHYGECWGRHWLDLVRYTDSFDARAGAGSEGDVSEAWRYRDWVVQAFNRDLPYDEFILDQLAGDIVAGKELGDPASPLVATGMLAIGNWGGGDADKEKLLTDIADDQVDVVSRAFLGLTVACARCHDHKFDPISTQDYYGLAGIFFSTHILPNVGPKTNGPPMLRIPLLSAEELAEQARKQQHLTAQQKKALPPLPMANGAQEGGVPGSPHAGIHDVRVHMRGRYDRLGELVPRRFPQVLAGTNQPPIREGSGRLQLARWLGSPENPLTARVMVNRIWQHHFGEGIVRTPSNFGKLGEQPTNPELLDYLAQTFMTPPMPPLRKGGIPSTPPLRKGGIQGGWSIKALHRSIMLSATYQQTSEPPAETLKLDPDNRLFGRMNRRRLEAEAIRDNLLMAAGRLDRTMGGPATRDFNSPRRTLYQKTIRSDRSTFRELFDAADSTAVVDRRTISTVAPQALFLLNHPFVLEQARTLARRIGAEGPADDAAKIDRLYVLLYARPASAEEKEIGLQVVREGWEAYCHLLLCANEFIYVD